MNSSPYLGYQQLGRDPNFELALSIPFDQLRFYCTSNDVFRNICMNQDFWFRRLQREYSTLIPYKPIDLNWMQYYNALATEQIKIVRVAYNGQIVGLIPMFTNDQIINVNQRAIDLLISMGINLDPNGTKFEDMKLVTPNMELVPSAFSIWEQAIIEFGDITDVLSRMAGNDSVHSNFSPDDILTFWDNLGIIHIYQKGLYPGYNGPVFRE